MEERLCPVCGKKIVPWRSKRVKYCSEKCRLKRNSGIGRRKSNLVNNFKEYYARFRFRRGPKGLFADEVTFDALKEMYLQALLEGGLVSAKESWEVKQRLDKIQEKDLGFKKSVEESRRLDKIQEKDLGLLKGGYVLVRTDNLEGWIKKETLEENRNLLALLRKK